MSINKEKGMMKNLAIDKIGIKERVDKVHLTRDCMMIEKKDMMSTEGQEISLIVS